MGNPSKDIPWLTIFDAYDIHNHDFDKEPFYITANRSASSTLRMAVRSLGDLKTLDYLHNPIH